MDNQPEPFNALMDLLKQFRVSIDANINIAEAHIEAMKAENTPGIREMALVRTKLQEAKMWVGKVMEESGSQLPPQFRDKAEKEVVQ